MAYPTAPAAGTTYVTPTGETFEYTAEGAWKRQSSVTAAAGGSVSVTAPMTGDGTAGSPLAVPAASLAAKGIIELATAAEVQAFTDTTRAVTPAQLGASAGVVLDKGYELAPVATAAQLAAISADADSEYLIYEDAAGVTRKATMKDLGLIGRSASFQAFNKLSSSTLPHGAFGVLDNWGNVMGTDAGNFDAATGIYTVPYDGFYIIAASAHLVSVLPTVYHNGFVEVRRNGSADARFGQFNISGTGQGGMSMSGSRMINCLAGDQLQVWVYQVNSASISVTTTEEANSAVTYFGGLYVGP